MADEKTLAPAPTMARGKAATGNPVTAAPAAAKPTGGMAITVPADAKITAGSPEQMLELRRYAAKETYRAEDIPEVFAAKFKAYMGALLNGAAA